MVSTEKGIWRVLARCSSRERDFSGELLLGLAPTDNPESESGNSVITSLLLFLRPSADERSRISKGPRGEPCCISANWPTSLLPSQGWAAAFVFRRSV
uniref:Uncharacterized protein n=1 Tax=Denticeps clupeoides TaxID=299321 RepID=A0AAY4EUL1_9TELE